MATTLDIIDTAVKIGLGAAIAGITSYLLTIRNQNYETRKCLREERKSLTKDLSIRIERVESITNESAFYYHEDNIESAKKVLIPASEEINIAKAQSNLLGDDELVEILQSISELVNELYRELLKDNPKRETFNRISREFHNNKDKTYARLRKIYNEVK